MPTASSPQDIASLREDLLAMEADGTQVKKLLEEAENGRDTMKVSLEKAVFDARRFKDDAKVLRDEVQRLNEEMERVALTNQLRAKVVVAVAVVVLVVVDLFCISVAMVLKAINPIW